MKKGPDLFVVFSKRTENVLFSFFLHKTTKRYSFKKIFAVLSITVKPLLCGHLRDRPLNRGCPLNRCLLTINIERLLCTVIKFHVLEETQGSCAVLYA